MISLGCPKNLVDSEVMLGLSEQAGHQLTPTAEDADIIIVNTCAFIDRAKQESVDTILEVAELKKNGACRRLIVTGCLAERYRDELRDQIPEIDAVLGTGEVPNIVEALAPGMPAASDASGVVPSGRSARAVSPLHFHRKPRANGHLPLNGREALPDYLYDADTPRLLATPKHYAYLKVAEGCDYKCAFCIIPRLRGPYRSRSADSILREARSLAARGVRELILISQDTTFYGVDRGERDGLASLLRALNRVDGVEWIRVLYLYPTTVSDAVIDAIAACDKVVKYIDLPLQHASDFVLKRMRRPGTRRAYERLLDRMRTTIPDVALRSTFIVGFPGETDEDVDELSSFLGAVGFDHVGVFTYSHEEGTAAGELTDDVPAGVKRDRRDRLMHEQKRRVRSAQKRRIGSRVRVLIDGASSDHEWVLRGRLPSQAPEIDPQVFLTDCDPAALTTGSIVDAEIVAACEYDLVARPLL
jgi:ribosomal protein S12 methylthiotransferase